LSVAAWVALAPCLDARIGERQGQIEDRLLADGTAQRLQASDALTLEAGANGAGRGAGRGRGAGYGRGLAPDAGSPRVSGFDISTIDNLLWRAIGQNPPAPDSNGVKKRPPDFPEYIYFKTDDGTPAAKKLQSTDTITGWEMRVYLYKQLSVLEIYRRIGAPLQDSDIASLLSANRGDTAWSHSGTSASGAAPTDNTDSASFIGYEYQRNDGLVRAHQVGNDLVIFSTEFDRKLLEVSAAVSKANAEKGSGPATAPTTHGF